MDRTFIVYRIPHYAKVNIDKVIKLLVPERLLANLTKSLLSCVPLLYRKRLCLLHSFHKKVP
jgi:hypothetical protein